MPNEIKPLTLAGMTVQKSQNPRTAPEARGRFFNSGNAFNIALNPVPDAVFEDEPRAALADGAPTGFTACDLSTTLGGPVPATTPLLLARYARIKSGETLDCDFETAGAIWYVITGSGSADLNGHSINWAEGDVFVLPGGPTQLKAGTTDAVLWVVTNEPQLAFENTRAVTPNKSVIDVVHFPADEIDSQIQQIYEVDKGTDVAGVALIFSSEQQIERRNITPTMTLAMNTLPPGETQPAHRHNSVALTLVVRGENCYSRVDGQRKNWTPWATTVTPPMATHSHTNKGSKLAKFLIVQDGGLYYHARTMGFSFD